MRLPFKLSLYISPAIAMNTEVGVHLYAFKGGGSIGRGDQRTREKGPGLPLE